MREDRAVEGTQKQLSLLTWILVGKKTLTFTFKALAHQSPEHFSTVVTESGGSVGMNEESMGPDLKVFKGG